MTPFLILIWHVCRPVSHNCSNCSVQRMTCVIACQPVQTPLGASGGSVNGWRRAPLIFAWALSLCQTSPLPSLAAETAYTPIISTRYGVTVIQPCCQCCCLLGYACKRSWEMGTIDRLPSRALQGHTYTICQTLAGLPFPHLPLLTMSDSSSFSEQIA